MAGLNAVVDETKTPSSNLFRDVTETLSTAKTACFMKVENYSESFKFSITLSSSLSKFNPAYHWQQLGQS